MSRPSFAAAWSASMNIYSPADPAGKVAKVIGGYVARNINAAPPHNWENTCAVRMSYILNQTGVSLPAIVGKTVSGADGRNYFFRVPDVINFLTQHWGKPDLIASYPQSGGGSLAGKQGVILFEVMGWDNARGHATLWNGSSCYDHCYFNEPDATYRTNRAYFWSLP
ncbi:MAG TPA: type VI secretion system amidase effector protein Tae4 [Thiobacillus sp.]